MTGKEIRHAFLQFFESKGHRIVPSSSLVPKDDPSLLLTTAGMQQFKPYFLGKESPWGNRVASVQKSFRTSDIEEVGDEAHLTFFEMLGNFSFNYPHGQGSYFKEEAIKFGLEFVQEVLGIDRKRISVSVFGGDSEVPIDTESLAIWKKLGFTDEEIKKGNREDNFWGPTGNEGPCGPTSEIYVDGVEIWNLVFNEYFSDANKKLTKLSAQGVDTGMGLERVTQVVQRKKNVYETDLFAPIMSAIRKSFRSVDDRSARVLSDHLRGIVFLIADGVLPGKDKRNYIPRRLIRRAVSILHINMEVPLDKVIFHNSVNTIINIYKSSYPYLEKKRKEILSEIQSEVESFSKVLTLIGTLDDFKKIYNRFIPKNNLKNMSFETRIKNSIADLDAKILFRIRETLGINFETMKMIIEKSGLRFSKKVSIEYDREYRKNQEKSRAGAEGKFGGHGLITPTGEIAGGTDEEKKRILRMHTATHLLHQALRDVFGDTIKQMGSDINGERLRFDFSHNEKLTPEQIKKVESIVNEKIKEDLPVYRKEMPQEEAAKTGALAFFKDKYGGTVSVYFIGSDDPVKAYSKEFCAGPHVTHTKEIGRLKILKEEAVGAGVRRIKATVV